jgi:hypothetical protein
MSKFSEEVFNKIDNAKIDEVKEIRFKVEIVKDVADILPELVKYSGNDKQLRDYNDTDFAASKIIYDYEKGKYYIDFE